jgi:hypothetical protein
VIERILIINASAFKVGFREFGPAGVDAVDEFVRRVTKIEDKRVTATAKMPSLMGAKRSIL